MGKSILDEIDQKFINVQFLPYLNDFYKETLLQQLRHEQKVKQYMVKNELEEVEVHGQKYKPIFKIDYDFEQYKDDCPVCKQQVCRYK